VVVHKYLRKTELPAFLFFFLILFPLLSLFDSLELSLTKQLIVFTFGVIFFSVLFIFNFKYSNNFYKQSILQLNIYTFYFAYLIISGIAVFFSVNLSEAFTGWMHLFVLFSFFLITSLILSDRENISQTISRALIILSLILFPFILYEFEKNIISDLLFFSIPFTAYGIIRFKKSWKVLALITSFISMFITSLIYGDHFWVSLIITFIFIIVTGFLLKNHLAALKGFWQLQLYKFALLILIFSSSLYISSIVFPNDTKQSQNTQYKTGINKNTLQIAESYWLTGVGPENRKIHFPKYAIDSTKIKNGIVFSPNPTNYFYVVLAESGIFGFIFYCLIFLTAVFYSIKSIKLSVSLNNKILSLFLLLGLFGLIINMIFNNPDNDNNRNIFVILYLALIAINYHKINSKVTKIKKSTVLVSSLPITILLLFSAFISLSRNKSEKQIINIQDNFTSENWTQLIRQSKSALSNFYTIDQTGNPLPYYTAKAYQKTGKNESALSAFKKALRIHPFHPGVLINLANINYEAGDIKQAAKYYSAYLSYFPSDKDVFLILKDIFSTKENIDELYILLVKNRKLLSEEKYKELIISTVRKKIIQLKDNIYDTVITKSLDDIYNIEDYVFNVHINCELNKNEIGKQLLIDAVYLTEVTNPVVTQEEIEEYKRQFNIK